MDRLKNQQEAELIDGIYQDLETLLMRNIARHIRNYDQPIPTDEWLLQKLAEIGKLDKEHIRLIGQMAGISDTAVQRMLEDMAANTIAELEPGYQYLARQGIIGNAVPAAQSRNVQQVVKTLKKQAKDIQNLSNTTMLYKARDAYKSLVRNIADQAMEIAGSPEFIELINEGVTSAAIGAESRVQALRRCIRRFVEKGIPAFVDGRGHEWTPEAYINMCMRTTSQKMATEIQMARADDHGIDLIEISSHAGARPRCAPFQGRIFDRANKSTKYPHWNTTSFGEPAGLFGINCGHHGYPYIEGSSIRRYFPTEDMDVNDKLYRETQKQRALERAVRKQKRECMLYNELGDKAAFEQAAVKLKSKEAKLKYFVDGNSQLHRRKDREQVVGFDKRISSEAVGSAQKHYKEWAKSAGAQSGPKTLAGYYEMKYTQSKESRLYKGYVQAVNKGRISPLVGYDEFRKVDDMVSRELDGLTTKDGQEVKGHTAHFVDRIIGTHKEVSKREKGGLSKRLDHQAVAIEEARDAILNGKAGPIQTGERGNRSQRIEGESCVVTINPDTGELIQTNRKR